MRPTLLGVALLLPFALGCETTVNPATGRREVLLMSPEQEREAEEEAEKEILSQFGLVHDEELAAYVQAVGDGLAAHSPRQDVTYRFKVVEMGVPNAFALPAGSIYVSRTLLMMLNSEAELANVLAHEIAHVAARHAAQRHAHQSTFGVATLLGNLASGADDTKGSRREGTGGAFGIAAYGRNQEREADYIGQDIVVRAGVDPTAMAQVLRTLQSERRRGEGYNPESSYFLTHPTSLERIAENATRAQIREWRPGFAIASGPEEFLAHLEGLPVGRPASEGVVDGNHFLHPELNFSLRFPPDWPIENANAYVIARSPRGDALVMLTLDSQGDDPREAAWAYARKEGMRLSDPEPVKIGALDAVRGRAVVETPAGKVDAELTWIAWDGRIYRLLGGRRIGGLRGSEGFSRAVGRTFRPLSAEERAQLTELRLRLARAEPGESLDALSRRTGNEWDLHQTAVANGIVVGKGLAQGQLVKIAVREPWRPQPEGSS